MSKVQNEIAAIYREVEALREFVLELIEEVRDEARPSSVVNDEEPQELLLDAPLSPAFHSPFRQSNICDRSRMPWTRIVSRGLNFEKPGPVDCLSKFLARCERKPTQKRLALLCEIFNDGSLHEFCGSVKARALNDRAAKILAEHEDLLCDPPKGRQTGGDCH